MGKVEVGDPAPPFELPGTEGRTYRLSDFRDTGVILAFYPGDFTPVCTKQFCSYRDARERLGAIGVPLVGISAHSVESHERWKREHGLTVPLLSDRDKSVSEAYGVLAPGGMIRRSVFFVDDEGIVRYRHVAVVGLRFQSVEKLEEAAASAA